MRDAADTVTVELPVPLPAGAQRVGYARVSTDDQRLDLQRDALARAGCAAVYADTASGKNTVRPELQNCLRALRGGDTLVVWRLDRLGRSLSDLVQIVNTLKERGVGFESVTEKIDTSSATGMLTFQIFGSLAQFERAIIIERTRAGLAAARARGRRGGRKRKLTKSDVHQIETLLADPKITVTDVAERYGVARPTLYRYLTQVKEARQSRAQAGKGA